MRYNANNGAYEMCTPAEITKIAYYYCRYLDSSMYSIFDAYDTPSYEKQIAFNNVCEKAIDIYKRAEDFRVITKNTFHFSMGYTFIDNSSGEWCFMWVTKSYKRYCPIFIIENSFR